MRIEQVLKRVILVVLTIAVLFQVSFSLVASWGRPQIQSRLELYQTNLLLHAAEWQGSTIGEDLATVRNALISGQPFQNAQHQYEEALQTSRTTQSKIIAKLQELSSENVATSIDSELAKPQMQLAPIEEAPTTTQQIKQLQKSLSQVEQLIDELKLRLGLLQAEQGKTDAAIQTWNELFKEEVIESTSPATTPSAQTAAALVGIWSDPPRILPDAESQIQRNLESWFRYRASLQLYQLQQRQQAVAVLQAQEQERAKEAIFKLALVAGIPGIGGLVGVVLLLFIVGQRLFQGRQAILATNGDVEWDTPWDAETVWQVLILGFFFIGQLLLPLILPQLFAVLSLDPVSFTVRMKAFYTLVTYLLLAAGGLSVLYVSIQSFLPLSEDWFRFRFLSNWFLWGLGGYLVALPLVILVSLINQQLWQGQGGSNPILPLVLEGQDAVALTIFFLTACIAAPLFEEFMFRGFLLPSLTRYMSVWGAIITSSLVFAIAHLSLSEILPLTTLGIVLGVVYTRSRNLLAPMLVHCLWNSGTLLSLFVLGSGSQ
ncbi:MULTISPECIES: CPBP family intramembrane glutamic endopeptidase [unclassified Coleofasciculus]|uniref:CPBP family intramembrane glutamic endopeptidase n=1 Tax=unclassified Coleofasciculus TaxID=2692782 RepID=UPI001880DA7C|nr:MULTISPECIES: CPBP family glutamic-type intramembrane protease [unclassified Coleofasciculus]MBE9129963.1 CPBP family intramembrane metalloprotease [Coleofasciculus sp. LEGE 07081]MBE9148076.1 CPBP family intramembrane metalloprotease [Coleofasciculus sp. LEGE 07092]